MFRIDCKISVMEKEYMQSQYISDDFIIIEIKGKKMIFMQDNTIYSVDTTNKILKVIDVTHQLEQINTMRSMLKDLKTEKLNGNKKILNYTAKLIKAYNKSEDLSLIMNASIIQVDGIEKTVYPDFMRFEQNRQLVNLGLAQCEIIAEMNSEIYLQGNLVQKQSMEIIEIETNLEDNVEFYEYFTYSYE